MNGYISLRGGALYIQMLDREATTSYVRCMCRSYSLSVMRPEAMSQPGMHSELDIACDISIGNLIIARALLRTYQEFQIHLAYSIIPESPGWQECLHLKIWPLVSTFADQVEEHVCLRKLAVSTFRRLFWDGTETTGITIWRLGSGEYHFPIQGAQTRSRPFGFTQHLLCSFVLHTLLRKHYQHGPQESWRDVIGNLIRLAAYALQHQ
jgi:hypothetical protein